MKPQTTYLVVLAALGAGVYVYWRYQRGGTDLLTEGILATTDVLVRGKRLNNTTLVNGVVRDNPTALAEEAMGAFGSDYADGLTGWTPLEIYSLARMSRSEAGPNDGRLNRRVRMHIAINDYFGVPWASSLDELFTYSTRAGEKGFFGSQAGRRYSTAKDPYEGDVKLAREVLLERREGIDPSGGATKFVDKSGLASQPGVTKTFDEIAASWAKEGLKPYTVDGLSSDFVVFRKA